MRSPAQPRRGSSTIMMRMSSRRMASMISGPIRPGLKPGVVQRAWRLLTLRLGAPAQSHFEAAMNPPPLLHSLAAMLLVAASATASYAQMGTPAPPGPPSAQPAPKSPSQPSSGESVKDAGGPQITVPLKRPEPAPVAEAASDAASRTIKAKRPRPSLPSARRPSQPG